MLIAESQPLALWLIVGTIVIGGTVVFGYVVIDGIRSLFRPR